MDGSSSPKCEVKVGNNLWVREAILKHASRGDQNCFPESLIWPIPIFEQQISVAAIIPPTMHWRFWRLNAILLIQEFFAIVMVVVLQRAFANLLFRNNTSALGLIVASFESVTITIWSSRVEHAFWLAHTPFITFFLTMTRPSLCHPPILINIVIITSTFSTVQFFHLILRAIWNWTNTSKSLWYPLVVETFTPQFSLCIVGVWNGWRLECREVTPLLFSVCVVLPFATSINAHVLTFKFAPVLKRHSVIQHSWSYLFVLFPPCTSTRSSASILTSREFVFWSRAHLVSRHWRTRADHISLSNLLFFSKCNFTQSFQKKFIGSPELLVFFLQGSLKMPKRTGKMIR